jgi:hypothetical protein
LAQDEDGLIQESDIKKKIKIGEKRYIVVFRTIEAAANFRKLYESGQLSEVRFDTFYRGLLIIKSEFLKSISGCRGSNEKI